MDRIGRLVAIFVITAAILQVAQTIENYAVERHRTLMRRQQARGGGEVGGSVEAGGSGSGSGDGGGGAIGQGQVGGGFNVGGNVGVIGSIGANMNSLNGLIDIPLQVVESLSGTIATVAQGVLGVVSSPVTLSGDVFDAFGLVYSTIVGPVSGTLFAGVQALVDSPETIQTSLSGGLQEVIQGITGALTSPFDIIDAALNGDIVGILSSPLVIVPALSGNLGITASGILEALSSPLTISAQVTDVGVESTLNSIRGFVPTPFRLALPHSISRGIQALIDSPASLADELNDAFEVTLEGIKGSLSFPLKLFSVIQAGYLSFHTDSPLIFPREFDKDLLSSVLGIFLSPLYSVHPVSAQIGRVSNGILTAVLSPLTISGRIIDYTLDVDVSSPRLSPEESDIGLPVSFSKGVQAIVKSPRTLSSTISDSAHLLGDGPVGLLTSPITVLCGLSPIPFPGSANNGIGAILHSPMDLADLLSENVGYTLAGLLGFLSSPVTLSAEILRYSVNLNVDSLNVLPEQLVTWGVPESIGNQIASFLQVPFDGLLNIIGFLESPLAILDGIAVANVPGSPNTYKIFSDDFPDVLPANDLPPYIPNKPCPPSLSGSTSGSGHASDSGTDSEPVTISRD